MFSVHIFLHVPYSSASVLVKHAEDEKVGNSVMAMVGKGYSHSQLKKLDGIKK